MDFNGEFFKAFPHLFTKKIIPNYQVQGISEIDHVELKKGGIEGIIFDLDGVLVSESDVLIRQTEIEVAFERLKEVFKCCILSNDISLVKEVEINARKSAIERNLHIKVVESRIMKPNPVVYKEAIEYLGLTPLQVAFITDKYYDVVGGNRAGVYTIKTKSIDIWVESLTSLAERLFEGFAFLFVTFFNQMDHKQKTR